jgi:uncharacterized phage protein (TIGR02216 family)
LSAAARRSPAPFPWREAMAFGLGAWRLSPRAFWAATPRELFAALEGRRGLIDPPADRAVLDALMTAYPDEARNG